MRNKTYQQILAKQIGRNRFNRLFADRHQADAPAALRTSKYSKMALLKRLTTEADKFLAEVKNER